MILLTTMAAIFLIILSILVLVYGERTTLDLSKQYNPKIFAMEFERNELSHTSYNPQLGVIICRVVKGNRLIWKQDRRTEQCIRFVVYRLYGIDRLAYAIIRRDILTYKYYTCKNDDWKDITSDEYKTQFSRLLVEQKVNIRNIDYIILVKQEYTPFGTPSFTYYPVANYIIATVMDGEEIIWESDDEKCEYFVLHGNENDPKLLQMFINHKSDYELLYLYRQDTKWIHVTKEWFYTKLEELDAEHGTQM